MGCGWFSESRILPYFATFQIAPFLGKDRIARLFGHGFWINIGCGLSDGANLPKAQSSGDHRGFFSETWNKKALQEAGVDLEFVQDNHSFSADKGTVRGLHFQAPPSAQDKLVRVLRGAIMDIAVDVRKGSPSYGQWTGVELTAENGKQLLVPKGFLHGFATLSGDVDVAYKCTDF